MSRSAEIRLTVDLDDDDLPTRIVWNATESNGGGESEAQSMMLSLWDADKQTTAAIDLWTKDATIDDMNQYFFQVIHKMADTYRRATRNSDVADMIKNFGDGFGDALGLR